MCWAVPKLSKADSTCWRLRSLERPQIKMAPPAEHEEVHEEDDEDLELPAGAVAGGVSGPSKKKKKKKVRNGAPGRGRGLAACSAR